ncbi:MAG TPA: amidohydrolase family protein [Burkholderiales bacterium]|jgi:cytosine/adenosine deaminase-related metal-dependent hydrolase
MGTTVIRSADWVIAWDGAAKRHVYRRHIDVAFGGAALTYVGPRYTGPADVTIDGAERMVMPGLVNVHSHPGHEPAYRGIREEHGVRGMYMTGLFERSQAYALPDRESRAAATEFAYCELLKSGVTSVVDIGAPWDGWAELAARSGLRAFLAPGFASARWKLENEHELKYEWDEKSGRQRFEAALAFVDGLGRHPSGRLSGVLAPMQIDTCSEKLLRDAFAAAAERRLPFTVHIAQGVSEVLEMIRRHGVTPIQWAAQLGILGPGTLLGHAIFIDSHSWVRWWTHRDLALMAEHGSTVAHCPTPFARYGHMLESFGGYLKAGVNMAIGTDTSPHNMLEEIRKASSLARIAARDIHAVTLADLLHAATIGGAAALLREDLGRIAAGAKADLVLIDLACMEMQPARDPLRSLVFHAADRAVREVFVDGHRVLAQGKVLGLDQAGAAARLCEAQQRMMAAVPQRDFRRRSAEDITPLSLPLS